MVKRYENDPTEMVEMIEGTYYDKQSGTVHYQIIDYSGKHELVYRELNSFPWVVSRYMKTAGERYGRGPVLTGLPDIKSLNKVKELALRNASLPSVVYLLQQMMVFSIQIQFVLFLEQSYQLQGMVDLKVKV